MMAEAILPNTPPKLITPGLDTPMYGKGGSFSVICSLPISASPAHCLATLLDANSYPNWNRFVRRVKPTWCPSPLPPLSPAVLGAIELIPSSGNGGDARPGLAAGPGMKFEFQVHMDLTESSRLDPFEMSLLDEVERDGQKGFRVAWKWLGMPGWVQRSERVQELVEDGQGGTVYKCWETFYGLVAPATRMAVGKKLENGFAAWAEGLKTEAEKRAREIGVR